jgi:hypothetical protein
VKRDETGARVNAIQQRSDVAVADDDFRVATNRVEVQMGEKPRAAPAAARRNHRSDVPVREESVDVGRPVLVCAAERSITVHDVLAHLHLEA